MGLLSDIQANLASRITSVTTANGYTTNVKQVFFDKVPMGLHLEDHELPAVLLLLNNLGIERKVGCNEYTANFEVQLILPADDNDDKVIQFASDIFKAIYSDSPTAININGIRTIHPAIFDVKSDNIEFDLNMIEANRFAMITLQVFFRGLYNNI
jgi:hypothetical protein